MVFCSTTDKLCLWYWRCDYKWVRNLDVFFKTEDYSYFGDTDVLTIINDVRTPGFTYEFLRELVRDLKCLTMNYGYKHKDILDCYWDKWNKNINRINSEWNQKEAYNDTAIIYIFNFFI